jgi:tetratricopeptide (TPR) repeat protein
MLRRFLFTVSMVMLLGSGATAQEFLNLGKTALNAKDTATAVTAFDRALKAGQKTAEASYYLAAIEYAKGKHTEALGHALTSVKNNDESVDALLLLGNIQVALNDYKAALESYKKAEKLAKKNPQVLFALGKTYLGLNQFDDAIKYLSLAKEYDATDAEIYVALGDAYLKQNVAALAISSYQKAIELAPRDFTTRYKLAELFEKGRQYNEAVKEYEGVTAVDSTYADAYLAVGKILVRAKLYPRAVAPLKKYVALQPKSIEGAANLAKALYGTHDYKETVPAAKRALELDKENVDLWRIYAESLSETTDFQGALNAYEEIRKKNQLKPEDQSGYGTALYRLGREEDALRALLTAVQADSTNCDPYASLGVIYMKRQDYANAALNFEKKIACDPRSLSSYVNAAACYMQVKNYPRTRELLSRTIELKPDFLQGRLWLGRYFALVDSLDLAKEQYDEVLRLALATPEKYKKEAGEAYQQIGQFYFLRKQYDRAWQSLRSALQSGQENSSLHLMWGQSLLQLLDAQADQAENLKKKEDAVRHFRRAIEVDPNNPSCHLWLGQGLILCRVEGADEANKKLQEEACSEYRKVLKLDPKNEDAKKGMTLYGCK